MKNQRWISVFSVVLFFLLTAPLSAESNRAPGVKAREHRQKHRIQQGVRSGEITRDEAKELREGRKETREKEKEFRSDGELTKEERKELHQDLNEQSKTIYDAKHNDEKRHRAEKRENRWKHHEWHKMNKRDRERLAQGIRSGEITKDELRDILESRKDLREHYRGYLEDGELSDEEAQAVRDEYDDWSKMLYEEKHDDESRD